MEHTGIAVGEGELEMVDEAGCVLEGLEALVGSLDGEGGLLVGFDLVNCALEGVV